MPKLQRVLNLPRLVFYGMASMVGAGIYSVIGAAAGVAGPYLWISFILAAVAAFLAVLSYAELSAMFPRAGAEYEYLKKGFPSQKLWGFLAGYVIILNAATTAATVAVAFGGYLNVFFSFPVLWAAFVLLATCTAINIIGIKESANTSIALALVEMAGLLLVIGIGFSERHVIHAVEAWPAFSDLPNIFGGTALVFFIYVGFENIVNLSEETIQPRRTVPRALLFSFGVTSLLYLLVAMVVLGMGSTEQLATSPSPLATAVATSAPWAVKPLAIAALFATASTALISLVSLSRVLFDMARQGEMPNIFTKILPLYRTPWAAALGLFILSCLFLPLGEVKPLASVSSLSVLMVFTAVQLVVIVLRYSQPDIARPFRLPLSFRSLPLIPVLGVLICLTLMTQYDLKTYGIMGAALVFGVLIFFLQTRRK